MKIPPFIMESWLIANRFNAKCNLAESGVRDITIAELVEFAQDSLQNLEDVVLQDEDTRGTEELRKAIASTYRNVLPEQILVTTGTSEALFTFFNCLLEPGNSVVVENPSFQALWQVPAAIGAKVNFVELDVKDGYDLSVESILQAIDVNTRLIVLNTPHNPTGRVRNVKFLKEVAYIAAERKALLLVDEHYRFLPLDQNEQAYKPLTSIADEGLSNVVVTGSITKCLGLIGLRVGWLIGPESILRDCRNYRDYLTHVLSPVVDRLTRMALKCHATIASKHVKLIKNNRDILEKFVGENSDLIQWWKPEGGAVAFLKLLTEKNSDEFMKRTMKREGVFVLPGSSFNRQDHIRICLGVDSEKFSESLQKITDQLIVPLNIIEASELEIIQNKLIRFAGKFLSYSFSGLDARDIVHDIIANELDRPRTTGRTANKKIPYLKTATKNLIIELIKAQENKISFDEIERIYGIPVDFELESADPLVVLIKTLKKVTDELVNKNWKIRSNGPNYQGVLLLRLRLAIGQLILEIVGEEERQALTKKADRSNIVELIEQLSPWPSQVKDIRIKGNWPDLDEIWSVCGHQLIKNGARVTAGELSIIVNGFLQFPENDNPINDLLSEDKWYQWVRRADDQALSMIHDKDVRAVIRKIGKNKKK